MNFLRFVLADSIVQQARQTHLMTKSQNADIKLTTPRGFLFRGKIEGSNIRSRQTKSALLRGVVSTDGVFIQSMARQPRFSKARANGAQSNQAQSSQRLEVQRKPTTLKINRFASRCPPGCPRWLRQDQRVGHECCQRSQIGERFEVQS